MARSAGFEGAVRVRAFVGVDGRVRRAETEGSPSLFDDAAVNAVRQWVFAPATSNGQPVAVWVRVPVIFRLH
jgi:protein TonB